MAVEYNKIPTFMQRLTEGAVTSKEWYFFWQGLFRRLAPAAEYPVTLTGSPFTFSAPVGGTLIVSGGTVSLIRFSRDGVTFYNVGATSGMLPLNAADRLEITYTVAPTVTFVPT